MLVLHSARAVLGQFGTYRFEEFLRGSNACRFIRHLALVFDPDMAVVSSGEHEFEHYPNVDHVHFYGFYIGNYPDLEREKIQQLCSLLNSVSGEEARYVS